jgi:hypothetical protein
MKTIHLKGLKEVLSDSELKDVKGGGFTERENLRGPGADDNGGGAYTSCFGKSQSQCGGCCGPDSSGYWGYCVWESSHGSCNCVRGGRSCQ